MAILRELLGTRDKKWGTIPYAEYRHRIQRAKELLAGYQMDVMILFSPTNWWYYGGWTDVAQMHNGVWRSCMVISQEHDPVIVGHGAFAWQIALTTYIDDLRFWHKTESGKLLGEVVIGQQVADDFWNLLADTLKDLKVNSGVIGIEKGTDIDTYLSFDEYDRLKERIPEAKIVGADDVIWEQRSVKSPYEIDIIREGCKRACRVLKAAFEAIQPGVNELDVHRTFWKACADEGLLRSPNLSTWLCWTSNAAEMGGAFRWITGPVDRIVQPGDMGISDCGPTYRGYQMDFQRTFYVGEPPQQEIDLSKIAMQAEQATIDALRPGVTLGEVYDVSLVALKKLDPMQDHIITFVGHSMGFANHEPPWIIQGEPTVIKEGMVFCVEVGAWDLEMQLVGAMPEDIILVTRDGNENLTADFSRELWVAK